MANKLERIFDRWSIHKITVAVLIASIMFAELIVMGGQSLFHRSIPAEPVIRALIIVLTVASLMSKAHSIYIDRMRQHEVALQKHQSENHEILQALPALYAERDLLATQVEERTKALQTSNAQLLHALQVRDEFLSNINHDLRTPLTPILAFVELLQNEHYGTLNSRQKQACVNIKQSAQDLMRHIEILLDFSGIKTGEFILSIASIDIHNLCHTSLRQFEPAARMKNLRVSISLDNNVTTIQADPQRLHQMLSHLLSNAVKFTPNGGAIGLKLHGDLNTRTVYLSVWDTGIGIDTAHLSRLFQPFSQVRTHRVNEHEGAGIGLALVHYLAELHGGSITVESQVEQGSCFTLVLPWNTQSIEPDTKHNAARSSATTSPSIDDRKSLILVVEDDPMNRQVLCQMLGIAGYTTIVAQDGESAIQAMRKHQPDLVLMDIQMPGMNGLETTRLIRADAELCDTPIIAVTASTMPGDRERCLEAGIDDYVSKPMDMNQLLAIIANILHTRPPDQLQILDEAL